MRKRSAVVTAVLVQILALAFWGVAQAAPLNALTTYTGGKAASADGIGSQGGVVDVETPANATVVQAFLYNITFGGTVRGGTTSASLNLNNVNMGFIGFENIAAGFDLSTYRADVTALVAPSVNANLAGGKTPFNLANITGAGGGSSSDGVALVVVFSAPSISVNQSVAILDGSQGGSAGPQTATFVLAGPLDKTVAGFKAILGVGINFSFQGAVGHTCGGGQFSTIDINASRLSSCSGNRDDGSAAGDGGNGQLITIGGVDDDTLNPPPACQTAVCSDDELYDISSFLKQGDLNIKLTTFNPSNDDALFVAVLQLTADILQTCTTNCSAVPAPATALLLGAGLLGLAVLRRALGGK
jgi:hypothetical protein